MLALVNPLHFAATPARRVSWNASRLASCLTVTLTLIGCSNSNVQVSGKVVAGNDAVAEAVVNFRGLDPPQRTYHGVTVADGTLHVDYGEDGGIVPGKYRITIERPERADGQKIPSGEEGAALAAAGKIVRRSYAAERDITPQSSALDLNLANFTPVEPEPQ